MRTQSMLSVLAVATAATAQTQPAPVVANNPVGAQYLAVLPDKASTTLRGSVQIQSCSTGMGVDVSVAVSGLPAEGGPFTYHIHEKPVPADGNCTGTGAHLDPYKRGETPPCDASKPETCQTGDLAGKHGKITSRDFSTKYTDLYLATLPESASYFGHLSVVFHFANKTRISCANFTLNSPGAPSSGYALPTGTGSPSGNYNMTVPTPLTPRPATETATAPGNGTAPTPLTPIPVNSTMSAPNGTTTTATGTVMPPTAAPSTTESAPPPPENSNAAQKLAAGAGALALAVAAVVF